MSDRRDGRFRSDEGTDRIPARTVAVERSPSLPAGEGTAGARRGPRAAVGRQYPAGVRNLSISAIRSPFGLIFAPLEFGRRPRSNVGRASTNARDPEQTRRYDRRAGQRVRRRRHRDARFGAERRRPRSRDGARPERRDVRRGRRRGLGRRVGRGAARRPSGDRIYWSWRCNRLREDGASILTLQKSAKTVLVSRRARSAPAGPRSRE